MAEYIEREALLADLDKFAKDEQWRKKRTLLERWLRNYGIDVFRSGVKNFPAADVAPVVHGRWEEFVAAETDICKLIHWSCSECGIVVDRNNDRYCPKCGAKMDGKEGGNNGAVD